MQTARTRRFYYGWIVVAVCAFAMIVQVLAFMRDSAGDVGLLPYGATPATTPSPSSAG